MNRHLLAIDQGTTGTTTLLYDEHGDIAARSYREFPQFYPQPGWVEHDPDTIWQTVLETVREVLDSGPRTVEAVGITNQRETTVMWDRDSGKPLHNAIVWQCRRTADLCRKLAPHAKRFKQRTGLPLDAYFSGTKIRWLLDQCQPNIDITAVGTIDSWLLWKLTDGHTHATDVTNASRTLLFNLETRTWDPELCNLLDVPSAILPDVRPSAAEYGRVTTIPGLEGVPILGVAGDQQAALFGQACFAPGEAKNTYGTGCFLLMNTGTDPVHSKHGLITTLAADGTGAPCYALEGSVFVAGAGIQWLRDELGLIATASDSESIAAETTDNGGVYLVPAFAGLGAPHWDMDARGTIVGLTRGSNRAHLVRAALEAMAYQSLDVLNAMEADTGQRLATLAVDGGAAANNILMQFQADLLGRPVMRPKNVETTSWGAACLAGLKAGIWANADTLRELRTVDRIFEPAMPTERRDALLSGWQHAIRQATTR